MFYYYGVPIVWIGSKYQTKSKYLCISLLQKKNLGGGKISCGFVLQALAKAAILSKRKIVKINWLEKASANTSKN